jgi:hypothetical protein
VVVLSGPVMTTSCQYRIIDNDATTWQSPRPLMRKAGDHGSACFGSPVDPSARRCSPGNANPIAFSVSLLHRVTSRTPRTVPRRTNAKSSRRCARCASSIALTRCQHIDEGSLSGAI